VLTQPLPYLLIDLLGAPRKEPVALLALEPPQLGVLLQNGRDLRVDLLA